MGDMDIESPNGDHTLAEYADRPHAELIIQADTSFETLGDAMQQEHVELHTGDMIIVSSTSPGMPKDGLAIRITGHRGLVLVSPDVAQHLRVREP